jgi:CRISPR/Cas system-associated exonuclease Cas4 (RecB family)
MREIIYDFAMAVLRKDEGFTPIEIVSLEREWKVQYDIGSDRKPVWIGGKIDRVDKTREGLRIIDYKTGKDEGMFTSIESLFARSGKRNKAAFQTLYYSLVLKKSDRTYMGPILPGLYNKLVLFKNQRFGLSLNRNLVNAHEVLNEFETRLNQVLSELYSETNVFDQTEYKKNCEYCSFRNLCSR